MSILIFVLILALLILIHELGHFIAAKKTGVLVEEFGIGFPPRIFSIKIGETVYSVNSIPLGGFVKLFGEEYHEVTSKPPRLKLMNRAFVYKPHWQKTLIIMGGVIGNFVLGWILVSFLFTQGVPTPTNKVIVENVQSNSPAAVVGIKEGDVITSLSKGSQQYTLHSVTDLTTLTKKFAGYQVELMVENRFGSKKIAITPRINPPSGQGALGIIITSFIEKKYAWYQAPFFGLIEAAKITKQIVVEIIKLFIQLITFQKPQLDITGPIGIARYTSQAIKFGKNAVLEFIALLSLNLAVVNILPFPALDGGRLMFVLYEWFSKRKVNKTVEKYLNLAGIIILLGLSLVVSINDIIKIYK